MVAQFSFDTLAFVKRLSAAGMDSRQAEALAEALNDNAFEALATKADLRELRAELKQDITDLELRLTNALTLRMGATAAAVVGILGTLHLLT